ncbi:hypothetical protein LIER_06460 [Lithospermum erythrorhizon]|uniref:Uncharacterized protein n=1 Tax=Lithospermum erythrorhizon TaxID=34254 RepID=A0AAV3P4N0_LITER
MTVKEVALRLRTEEDNRKEKKGEKNGSKPLLEEAKANIVEQGSGSKSFKGKQKDYKPKAKGIDFKKKFEGKCFICDKKGHKSHESRFPKKKKAAYKANMVNKVTNAPLFGKGIFTNFKPLTTGDKMYMGNFSTSTIEEVRKNLIFGSLLNKHRFLMVMEADKLTLSKAGIFVGKGYILDGLFKLNVMTISNMYKMTTTSAYLIES